MGRLALFTPLPPARTGTADYAEELVSELRQLTDVQVFERVPSRFSAEKFDAVLYAVANNPYHEDIYSLALEQPGIVLLHETNFHHLIRHMTQNREEAYLREIVYEIYGQELGSVPIDEAEPMVPQTYEFTMMRRLLDRSKACVVHSRFAESEVRVKGFRGPVGRIPHGAKVGRLDGGRQRERLGIAPAAPVIGMFGYQRPDKQEMECLGAFRSLVGQYPDARLLVAGEPHPEVHMAEEVSALGLGAQVHLLGFQPPEEFDACIAACDVVLNLRWPTFGETSGTMMRAMGLGRAVVVSDVGPNKELPDGTCVRIPNGHHQRRILLECLRWLLSDRQITEEIGRCARQWVAGSCGWDTSARLCTEFLRSVRPGKGSVATTGKGENDVAVLRQAVLRWTPPDERHSRYTAQHIRRLVRVLELTPPGHPEDRVLEMGCYLQITPVLKELRGYGEIRGCYLGSGGADQRLVRSADGSVFQCAIDLFDAETDVFPYPSNYFSTVICSEIIEHLQRDPMRVMYEVHRVLKARGLVILTTPNAASLRAVAAVLEGRHPAFYSRFGRLRALLTVEPRHAREYTPSEVAQLMTDSGFTVVAIETGPYGDVSEDRQATRDLLTKLQQPAALRDECIHAVGRKADLPRTRYPSWLYDD